MLLVLLIGIHFLLLSVYAMAIELKVSRHPYIYLIYAACVPFAGELALFLTEFGKTAPMYNTEKMFFFSNQTKEEKIAKELDVQDNIGREFLLNAIEQKPSNLPLILKNALNSSDIEVVHVAAATIMKLQREYENNIKLSKERYLSMPENMAEIKQYIKLVGEYYSTHLLNGESAVLLLKQQEESINKLLSVLPDDYEANYCLIENLYLQKKYQEALTIATNYRKKHFCEFLIWKWCFRLLESMGNTDMRKDLVDESAYFINEWTISEQKQWKTICEGMM